MTALRQLLGGRRQVGVLLHVTALPAGSFGAGAQQWLQLLSRHRVGVWQVMPLAPTDGTGSPYSSPSGFALNPALLDQQDPLPPWTDQSTEDYRQWCRQQRHWLQDHARFMVLRARFEQQPWWQWPEPAARRSQAFLRQLGRDEAPAIAAE